MKCACVLRMTFIAREYLTNTNGIPTVCVFVCLFACACSFDNNSQGNHGDNCASFSKNNQEEGEIDAGTRKRCV